MRKKRSSKINRLFSKKNILIGSVLILLVVLFLFLYFKTGFFVKDKIDSKDLAYWEYEDGIIKGMKEFSIEGNFSNCWYMIHGYCAGPNDYKELSKRVNEKFGDYVYVTRLEGHGEVPSHVVNLTLEEWYKQVSLEFDDLKTRCDNINVVGFSFGGTLATRLGEEKDVKNIYLIAPYIDPTTRFLKIIGKIDIVGWFVNKIIYTKKFEIAQLNDPSGKEEYISYWTFPLAPVRNSRPFIDKTLENSGEIINSILIQQSVNDDTASFEGTQVLFNKISSEDKKLIKFEKSSHVLLYDYDKEEVIKNILEFELERR